MEYLLKCSSRHCLQNLWPHFVSIGSFRGNWQIAHCKSSSTSFTNSSSYPPRDLFAGASAIFSWALTRRMIREWPADQLKLDTFYRFGRGGSIPLSARFLNFVCGRKCLCHVFSLWQILHLFAAGHQPAADHILDPFEIFGSIVRWFDGYLWLQRCAVSGLLSCRACLSLSTAAHWHSMAAGATRHFVLLSCKICAEIVVYRMLAVFLNGLNGKNSSRRIVRDIFSVYF